MNVSMELPDTALLTRFDHDYLKRVLVVTLYHLGQLSEHEVWAALRVTRHAVDECLSMSTGELAA
jgi:hypothetical protein